MASETECAVERRRALNARPKEKLVEWIQTIKGELAAHDAQNPDRPSAPFAVNQIVHRSNDRLEHDLEVCVRHEVPIIITSLGAREDVNAAVHSYGGVVYHDVINARFAEKAVSCAFHKPRACNSRLTYSIFSAPYQLSKGADGLIAVAHGAGGHAGRLSPFALVDEIRSFFSGPLALSGSIGSGQAVLAARAAGADFAYVGSPFIATVEANASDEYKQV